MEVTALNQYKNGFIVTFDTNMKFQVSTQILTKFRLYINKVFDKTEFESFKKEVSFDQIHQRCLSLLSKRKLSSSKLKQRIKEFLRKNNLEKLEETSWSEEIEKLNELGLLNDEELVQIFIRNYSEKKKGKNYIKQKLIENGFSKELITKYLSETEDNLENLEILIRKKFEILKSKKLESMKLFEKLVRFGIGRGFESGKVIKIVKSLLDNN